MIQSHTLAEFVELDFGPPPTSPSGLKITFNELVTLEPRLGTLLFEAQSHTGIGDPKFCANAVWYGYNTHPGLKPRLLSLVGWDRPGERHSVLSTPEAYDVAYDTIYLALPDCRDCGGCWARC